MTLTKSPLQVSPGKGLGFLSLGGSLHDILVRLKTQPSTYPIIDVSYSSREPLISPIVVSLPRNGLRLRFDGPDQRLRLIEVRDFHKTPFTYKGETLVKVPDEGDESMISSPLATGPAFRQVYHRLFGPTYAGEYHPPSKLDGDRGTYVLSYPGVAFTFSIDHGSWSPKADFVSVLSSPATSAATCLTIFSGPSWKDARQDFLTRPCPHPRSLALIGRGREGCPEEIDLVRVKAPGVLEMVRRGATNFTIVLSETNQQDLVAQLGPPDAIYRKYDRKISIHKNRTSSRSDHPPFAGSPGQIDGYSDTDRSSANTSTEYSSHEDDNLTDSEVVPSQECFYNYFYHGFDIFMSYPSITSSHNGNGRPLSDELQTGANAGQLVATKILLHGNVPGSYAFNRYRRCRWVIETIEPYFTSEDPFKNFAHRLHEKWEADHPGEMDGSRLQRPMVLNRDWADSPSSSFDFADLENSKADLDDDGGKESILGNTQLYGFPGYLFEVLKNDAISCLTIY